MLVFREWDVLHTRASTSEVGAEIIEIPYHYYYVQGILGIFHIVELSNSFPFSFLDIKWN